MANIPAKIENRFKEALKRFQPVVEQAKSRDIGEADTSTLVKDILSDLFGYDKYAEITGEFQIKGTYCDLAIKLDNKVALLIEIKAIGIDLKEAHVKQAIDYAANQGVEWVVLTNAQTWSLYRVTFGQPIGNELLLSFQFNQLNQKSDDTMQSLYLLSKEGQGKSLLDEYHQQKQVLSRFAIGAIVLSEPILNAIRKEIKKLSPEARVTVENIKEVLEQEVIKREVIECEKADEVKKKMARVQKKLEREKEKNKPSTPPEVKVSVTAEPSEQPVEA